MSVQDASMAVPRYPIDKVMRTLSTNDDRTNAVTATSGTISTPFTTDAFIVSIYSTDGGISWQDSGPFWSSIPTGDYQLNEYSRNDGDVVWSALQNNLIGAGATFNLLIKRAYIARPDQPSPVDTAFQYSGNTAYRSSDSYMKIFDEDSFDLPAKAATTIAHGLGYEPMVQVYVRDSAGDLQRLSTIYNSTDIADNDMGIEVTPSDITIRVGTFTTFPATVYYRIYYEG